MYGKVVRDSPKSVKARWEGGETVLATAYDMPITGYNTFNTNNLRLWRSRPYDEFDNSMYSQDDEINKELTCNADEYHSHYFESVEKSQDAEYISSIFYPNDNTQKDKEIRLK